ncbi:MAG: outer membrane lipoprotein carrier protein LolA [Phycisphaerae bacterium]
MIVMTMTQQHAGSVSSDVRSRVSAGGVAPRAVGWCGRCTAAGAAIILAVATPPARAVSPEELVEKLSKRYQALRSIYTVTTTVTTPAGAGRPTTVTRKLWLKRDGDVVKTRIVSRSAGKGGGGRTSGGSGRVAISDGHTSWREIRVQGRTMVFKSPAVVKDPLDDLGKRLAHGRGKVLKRETIAGEACVLLEITFGQKRRTRKETYWLSERYGVVMKSLRVLPDGSTSETTTSQLTVNQPIADAQFTYAIPDGATVVDTATIGGRSAAPRSAPPAKTP